MITKLWWTQFPEDQLISIFPEHPTQFLCSRAFNDINIERSRHPICSWKCGFYASASRCLHSGSGSSLKWNTNATIACIVRDRKNLSHASCQLSPSGSRSPRGARVAGWLQIVATETTKTKNEIFRKTPFFWRKVPRRPTELLLTSAISIESSSYPTVQQVNGPSAGRTFQKCAETQVILRAQRSRQLLSSLCILSYLPITV